MKTDNRHAYLLGLQNGWPIGVGYFAVSFAMGIAAKKAGFSAAQASVMSLFCLASAGQFAGITLAAAGSPLLEMALMQLVVNARYLLMSFALTQKCSPSLSTKHRLLMSWSITDEIFGLCATVKGDLNPFFEYGLASAAAPGWVAGTYLGVVLGSVLPAGIVSALSVGLYGMFLAIILPPARHSRVLAVLVPASMAASWLFSELNAQQILVLSSGARIILLTIVISLLAAVFFPHKEENL